LKINFTVLIEDLQQAIEEERIAHQKSENETEFDFSRYHTYEEILNYLENEVSKSDLVVIDFIGKSFEGRKIPVIRITDNKLNNSKPIILIDSLIHAREWVTGATNLFIINQLFSNKSMQNYLKKFEFHIIPMFNPDGYAYSWRFDRLWRKTRTFSIGSIFCRGADANRNFDIHFRTLDEENTTPCSENYCGDYAFSEPEVVAFRDYTLKLNQTNVLLAYFSLHSYTQKLLYPYSYTSDPPINFIELKNLSNIASNAIKSVYGSFYKTGSAFQVMCE
jgi:murein tripeptide amidase MpaA